MSSLAEEEEERQGEQARHSFYYSPCSLFENAIKAFLKCLGLRDDHHDYYSGGSAVTDDQNHPHPDPDSEREMKFTEQAVILMASARSATSVPPSIARARARPKKYNKPPISSGSGGQIN